MVNKQRKMAIVIPSDRNIRKKEHEKFEKSLQLREELEKIKVSGQNPLTGRVADTQDLCPEECSQIRSDTMSVAFFSKVKV